MKKQITEEQIKQISTGEKDIRDVFPEVFETKLEVGKWYKDKDEKYKGLICIEKLGAINNGIIAYGFGWNSGRWVESNNKWCPSNKKKNDLVLATPQEVEEALIKEAKRRGYEVGVEIKSFLGGKTELTKGSMCGLKKQYFWLHQCIVFQNGKWAEIISKPIKKYEDLKEISGYYVTSYRAIYENTMNGDLVTCKTYEQAEALIALAQLSQLIPEYNGDWVSDFSDREQVKYCIRFWRDKLEVDRLSLSNYFLAFKTREIAEEFLQNNRELILKAKPFLG